MRERVERPELTAIDTIDFSHVRRYPDFIASDQGVPAAFFSLKMTQVTYQAASLLLPEQEIEILLPKLKAFLVMGSALSDDPNISRRFLESAPDANQDRSAFEFSAAVLFTAQP